MTRISLSADDLRRSARELEHAEHAIGAIEGHLTPGLAFGAPPATAAIVAAGLMEVRAGLMGVRGDLGHLERTLGLRAALTDLADAAGPGWMPGTFGHKFDWFGDPSPGGYDPGFFFRGFDRNSSTERFYGRGKDGKWRMESFHSDRTRPEGGKVDKFFGVERKAGGLLGISKGVENRYGSASVEAGLRGEAGAKAGYDGRNAVAEGSLGASLGVSGRAEGHVGNEHVGGLVGGSAFAGAEGKASAGVHAGKDGVGAKAEASAFAGVEAEAHASGHVSGVTATGGAGVSAGIGAHAKGDASLDHGKVHVKADVGVAVGLGGKLSFDVTVDPMKTVHDAGSVAGHVGGEIAKHMPKIEPPRIGLPSVKVF